VLKLDLSYIREQWLPAPPGTQHMGGYGYRVAVLGV
jgi:hypothetical protein